jgi:hypothetical protein
LNCPAPLATIHGPIATGWIIAAAIAISVIVIVVPLAIPITVVRARAAHVRPAAILRRGDVYCPHNGRGC